MANENGNCSTGGENKECITSYVDDGSVESHRLYLSRRTVLEMLRDRGYLVPDSELSRSLADFRSEFGPKFDLERLRLCFSLVSEPSKKILVIFCGTDEIRKADILAIFRQIVNKESLHRLMLILQSKMNSFARKEADNFSAKVEIFQITELLVNVTKHILMPKHKILTAAEKQILLKKYKLEDKQLPRMLQNDAIARYYGLEKGQVMRVAYRDGITGSLVTYRCVM
ncbi:hypothetical protein L1049_011059 [Liquidambar formosana]|uniref:Uncharacterized protein n=1 Tax=Liquidambar formosana TaxID=63359 RepID=A0AAP0WZH0_LIQFO